MASEEPIADEIAALLDQCSPEELAALMTSLESGGDLSGEIGPPQQPSSPQVLPPAGPPPAGAGRRPVPAGVRRIGSGNVPEEEQQITMSEAKQLLQNHHTSLITDVCKMAPFLDSSSSGGGEESLNLEMLTQILAARDEEVKELEGQLNTLQAELSAKDLKVADLGGELDLSIRELKHRQLDLEFQQLKLDEVGRKNAGMEQAQASLVSRVEEAGLHARHLALDVDLSRTLPGSVRVQQGSLPWSMRKNRTGPP